MGSSFKPYGYNIPTSPENKQGRVAQGFVTPVQDKSLQIHNIPSRQVIPIIFIPGIMGSNLRMSRDRQLVLGQKNNIAWRPDNSSATASQYNDSPEERQMRLDPRNTEVDTYDAGGSSTGNPEENADQRNGSVRYSAGYRGYGRLDGPLLQADDSRSKNFRTQDQKARERGWGEIFFGSYQQILTTCESKLNSICRNGVIGIYFKKYILNTDPVIWNASPRTPLKPIDEEELLKAVKGSWFPVHAMGYNWLKGNASSGMIIAKRISELIKKYQDQGYKCEKVILVTHSMGGLVARAAIHPKIGNVESKVLGIVHGVMPAVGAGAAYKRMRCGVEADWYGLPSKIAAGVLGNNGADVTAVLASAQGALELLPSRLCGSNWLQVQVDGKIVLSWPKRCPYEEIYKVQGKWYGLFNEPWLNPAGLSNSGMENTIKLLTSARRFHEEINDHYHQLSYAHYCGDPSRKSWYKVTWEVDGDCDVKNFELLQALNDEGRGSISLVDNSSNRVDLENKTVELTMLGPNDPGDQTVPCYSAQAQLRSGKFSGIFEQNDYEHQASYDNDVVIASTMYSLIKIIGTMKWSGS